MRVQTVSGPDTSFKDLNVDGSTIVHHAFADRLNLFLANLDRRKTPVASITFTTVSHNGRLWHTAFLRLGPTPAATVTIAEAAAYLGLGRETVRASLVAGAIHGFQVGKAWRIPRDELDRVVAGQSPNGRST